MRTLRTGVTIAAVVVAVAIAPAASADPPHTPLGGLDLWSYCQSSGYDGVVLLGGQIAPGAAFNWRCFRGTTLDPIDMLDACRWQYSRQDVHADFLNRDDAYTWVCYAGARDDEPPTIDAANVIVDATGPDGAAVTYSATATDDVDPSPTLACSPSSGSLFPIGTSEVTCTATDAAGNSSSATFAVVVRGAVEQLDDFTDSVEAMNLEPQGIEQSFVTKLEAALAALVAGDVAGACESLQSFIDHAEAQRDKKLTEAQADALVEAATRIRTVLTC